LPKLQLAGGSIGICAAKISEAEVFSANGIEPILMTTSNVTANKIRRAMAIRKKNSRFIQAVLPEAVSRGIGVIGMKVCAQGRLLGEGGVTMDEAMGYVLSLPGVSTVIVGCETPNEVEENARIARQFKPFGEQQMRMLEKRTSAQASALTCYKML
jgi:predicted aldo/keto reductase-like oxidoreductase